MTGKEAKVCSRLGAASAAAVAGLSAAYLVALVAGLLLLPSPTDQIQDPWFTAMEILILLIAPAMVVLAIAVQCRVPDERRAMATIAVAFFIVCATITMAVHMVVLVMSRGALDADPALHRHLLAFQWPSVAYALDVLAWDVAFPIGALAAAAAIPPSSPMAGARKVLIASAVLAFAGLVGVPLNDMRLRNIGIAGYALLFPIAAGMIWRQFAKELR